MTCKNSRAVFYALSLLVLLGALPAQAQPEESGSDRMKISFGQSGDAALTVTGFSEGEAEVFTLSDPARIVLDLIGTRSNGKPVLSVQELPFVEGVRIGMHPDRVRVVLDLADDKIPRYELSQARGSVSLSFFDSREEVQLSMLDAEIAEADSRAVIEPAVILSVQRLAQAYELTGAKLTQEQLTFTPQSARLDRSRPARMVGSTSAIGLSTEAPQQEDRSQAQQLTDIRFSEANSTDQPELVLNLSHRPRFSVKQQSRDSYSITIPEAELAGEHLALPFFPPHRFEGLKMIRADQRAGEIQIVLAVDQGATVRAFARGSDLIIQVQPTTSDRSTAG